MTREDSEQSCYECVALSTVEHELGSQLAKIHSALQAVQFVGDQLAARTLTLKAFDVNGQRQQVAVKLRRHYAHFHHAS